MYLTFQTFYDLINNILLLRYSALLSNIFPQKLLQKEELKSWVICNFDLEYF